MFNFQDSVLFTAFSSQLIQYIISHSVCQVNSLYSLCEQDLNTLALGFSPSALSDLGITDSFIILPYLFPFVKRFFGKISDLALITNYLVFFCRFSVQLVYRTSIISKSNLFSYFHILTSSSLTSIKRADTLLYEIHDKYNYSWLSVQDYDII